MDFIRDNFEIIVIILIALTIAILSILIGINRYILKYFTNEKYFVVSRYETNPVDQKKHFSISIFNRNVNDSRITAFGYVYRNQNIDYYKTYLSNQKLPEDHRITIPSRDSIITRVETDSLKTVISDINSGKTKVSRVKAFVTDSLGLTTLKKAPALKKHLRNLLVQDQKEVKRKNKERVLKLKAEQKQFRQLKRVENRIKWNERKAKFILKVKKIFSKKK